MLQAFAAAARSGSFTEAAADLEVTQGPISRQVRALEQLYRVASRRLYGFALWVTGSPEDAADVVAMEGEYATGSDLESDYASTYEQGSPLQDIQFEYDSAALTEGARATLEKHALWLQGRRDVRVTVEGHCDQRGTTEYNLALGEQRARAVWDYLVGLGVAAERLRTVSYGKEQPLDPSDNEAAYAKNRRAHFSVSQ